MKSEAPMPDHISNRDAVLLALRQELVGPCPIGIEIDCAAPVQLDEAEAAYRRGLAIAEEPDVQTRLLVALAGSTADSTERVRLLHEAMDLGGNLVAAAMASVLLRASPDAN